MEKKVISIILALGIGFVFSGYTEENIFASSEQNGINEFEINESKPSGFYIEGYENVYANKEYYIVQAENTNLYGLIDANGNQILPVVYDDIDFLELRDELSVEVEIEGKWGIYDCTGKEIVPVECEKIVGAGRSQYLIQKNGKQSLIGKDGSLIKELENEYTRIDGDYFLIRTTMTGNKLFDINGKELSEYGVYKECDSVLGNKELIYSLLSEKSDDYKVIDENGNIIFEQVNDKTTMEEGYAVEFLLKDRYLSLQKWRLGSLSGENEYYLYDMIEQKKNDTPYLYVHRFDNDWVCCKKADGIDIYDENGNMKSIVLEEGYSEIKWSTDNPMLAVKYGETYRLYNSDGERITEDRYLSYDFEGQYMMVENLEGEYGILDKNGNTKVPFGVITYDEDAYYEEAYYGEEIHSIESDDNYLYILTEDEYEDGFHLYVI